jgi:lysophospholipase L1-like esterase
VAALALASFAVGLAILEGGVRLLESIGFFLPPVVATGAEESVTRRSDDPGLGWELDPAAAEVNSAGFRDDELPPSEPPGRRLVALLGDSVAFGQGLPRDQAVADRLESELGDGWDVLNCGVGGYNTGQSAELYERRVRPLGPDVVVLLYVLNDAIPAERMLAIANLVALQRAEPGPAAPLGLHSLARLGDALARLRGLDPERIAPYVHETHRDEETWRSVEAGLARIGAVARADGAELLLAITPLFVDLDDYAFADVHAQVARAAAREGFAVLDLREALRGHDPALLRLERRDLIHPSPLGHRLIAQAIASELRRSASP